MSHAAKKWEIFPGRNKFCLDGKVIRGPDVTVFCINIFLIVGTTIIFLIFDCPDLTTNVSFLIPVATIILFIFVMSSLLKTSFTDPGIIPRATPDEAIYIEKQIKIAACGDAPADRPPPRTKEVLIRGQCVKLKYCFTCKIFRPPRASHCSLCDNCVDHFDHHCPWVGNCVGRRNYRYFYLFTVTLSLYIAFVFVCTCVHLYLLSQKQQSMVDAIASSPGSVIVLLITFFSCWSVFGLAIFHSYLAASNQTTNEDIKGSFSNKRGGSNRNPYSTGNGCSNCCYTLCGPFTPSLIDSEGFITPESVEKKFIAVRQNSRVNTPLYPGSSNYNVHYQLNGVKAFSSHNHSSNRIQSSVISGPHFGSRPHSTESTTGIPKDNSTNNNQTSSNKIVAYENADDRRWDANSKNNVMMMDVSKIDLDLDDVEAPSRRFDNKNSIPLEPLSASKLQLLQDTTMIESALDLDSLEESTSSLGTNSHAGLVKSKLTL